MDYLKKKGIFKPEDLPEHEEVYLKKGSAIPIIGDLVGVGPKEWRVVYPIKNDDGSNNWFNLLTGGWGNLMMLFIIMALLLGFIYGFWTINADVKEIASAPCSYCAQMVHSGCTEFLELQGLCNNTSGKLYTEVILDDSRL